MNLSGYRTRVCRAIGLSTTDADDLALVDTYVNEGIEQFLTASKVTVRTAALAVTAGTGDYTLDTDILSFESAWYAPSDNSTPVLLEPVSPRQIEQARRVETTAGTAPRHFALAGADLLMLYPTPASDDDLLHILYVPRPDVMSLTADSPASSAFGSIPAEYHYAIEAYAKWKTGESEEHQPSQFGQVFKAQYQEAVGLARASAAKKSGVYRGGVVIGRRRPATYTSPGVDDGR
jgi:hypothetical protein